MTTTVLTHPQATTRAAAIARSVAAVLPETMPALAPSDVLSHLTAARLHGMPVLDAQTQTQLHVSHPRKGLDSSTLRRWRNPVLPADQFAIGGLQATTAARTVVDLSRDLGVIPGVLAADHVLRAAHDREAARRELHAAADAQQRRNRFAQVRTVLQTATGDAACPAESIMLAALRALGLTGFRQRVVLPGAAQPASEYAVSFLFPPLRAIIDVHEAGEPTPEVHSAHEALADLGYEVVACGADEIDAAIDGAAGVDALATWAAGRLQGTALAEEISPAAPGLRPTGAAART